MSYWILLQILDEIGLKPKRLAGASAGAICAALVAAGYTTDELEEILKMNLEEVLIGLLLLKYA